MIYSDIVSLLTSALIPYTKTLAEAPRIMLAAIYTVAFHFSQVKHKTNTRGSTDCWRMHRGKGNMVL